MNYIIEITKSAAKDFKEIREPEKSRIKKKIDSLAESGLEMDNITALKGEFKGLFRIRSGDFRIVFTIENNTITIVAIVNRKEVYKKK